MDWLSFIFGAVTATAFIFSVLLVFVVVLGWKNYRQQELQKQQNVKAGAQIVNAIRSGIKPDSVDDLKH